MDSSIYGALVGASQPWNMRYPLIDFHGNNGSRDNDGPAAMRYTECRLSKIAEATLTGIKKDTVDWVPNFDETAKEPVYLPGVFPNLLCNGTTGIAVAMACSFAPHNLNEIMNAAIAYLKGEAKTSEDLLNYICGPDFPTGGLIINQKELSNAYLTGKGRVRIRGEYEVETTKDKRDRIVFTSIPYKISKETLTTEIDNLCEEKKINGIREILDQSNKDGVRFVIELDKGYNADIIAAQLYELTDLETVFNINMVALENKIPKQMTLLDIIKNYINHQKDVFYRLNQYEKKKLDQQIHILEGLTKALEDIDNIIQLIKKSKDKQDAKVNLINRYEFSSEQADAILSMTLSRLANMEKIAIENQLKEASAARAIIVERLKYDSVFTKYLADCLNDYRKTYADERRTKITNIELTKEEKEVAQIVSEDVVVVVTEAGNIKRVPKKNFKTQKRNGKGVKTQDDCTLATIDTNTIDVVLAFTNKGKVYRIGVDTIPEGIQSTRGVSIGTLVEMENKEHVVAITSANRTINNNEFVWFITKQGLIKKTNLNEYNGAKRKQGVFALGLREGDELASVWIGGNSDVLLISEKGMSIRFNGENITPVGRLAAGVIGMKLNADDAIAAGIALPATSKDDYVFICYKNGAGKRIYSKDFVRQNRGGKGLKISGDAIISAITWSKSENENFLVSGNFGSICIKATEVNMGTRASAPVKIIKNDTIIAIVNVS